MHAAVSVDDAAQLARLETESSIFKGLLHLPTLEEAEIASGPC